jgi:hypothetical protein
MSGSTSGTTLLRPSAVASGTLDLPAATDTLVGKATVDQFTNKSYNTEGTGNDFTSVVLFEWQAGVCQNGVATLGFSFKTSAFPSAGCLDGTNTVTGTADFDKDTDESVQWRFMLPTSAGEGGTFTGAVDVEVEWVANDTGTNSANFCVATGATATGGSMDPALDDKTCANSANTGTTANLRNYLLITGIDVDDWASGRTAWVRFYRNADASDEASGTETDNLAVDARVLSVRIIYRKVG